MWVASLVFALVATAPPPPLTTVPYDRSQQRPLLGNLFQASLGRLSYNDRPGTPAAWTTALVSASAGGLQLAVECHEPRMDKLVATHRERDSDIWVDDCLEVFVQPPGQPYRHFIVNPLGTQFDELVRDARWNADWQATARRGEQSWAVDLTLPWAALGATPKLGDIWRFNLCRSRRPEPELSAWSPTAQGFHEPARFGELRFGAGPHVTSLDWRLETRRGGRLKVSWAPADAHVSLRLNGQPSDGTFSCPTEGLNELVFEAVSDGQAVLRLPLSVLVTPLGGAVDAVRRRLAAIAATPAKAAMTERLDSLAKLADSAPPDLAGDVLRQLQDLERQASHLAVGSACAKAGRPADGIAYGTESSLRKILGHLPFDGAAGGPLVFDAGRREMDAAQLVVVAGEAPLTGVRATCARLVGPAGRELPATALRARRVGEVLTAKPTYAVPHVGLWPDPLLPLAPFDVSPGERGVLWVDVRVPADQPAGLYRGQLLLTALSARATAVPVEVRVRNFTIPARPSVVTAFGVSPSWPTPQDRDASIRNALEHRVTPYTVGGPKLVRAPAMDWSRAKSLEIELTADRPGTARLGLTPPGRAEVVAPMRPVQAGSQRLTFDVSAARGALGAWRLEVVGPVQATATVRLVSDDGAKLLVDHGLSAAAVAEGGWLADWPQWGQSGWDQPDLAGQFDWREFDAAVEKYLPLGLSSHLMGLSRPLAGWAGEAQRHLAEKGWLDLGYTYLMDEPEPKDYPEVNRVQGAVKRAAPGLRNMMTARAFPPELRYVDVWCPEAYSFDAAAAAAEQARGKSVWWYVAFSTRHPLPNVWIDYPALDCRIWPWLTWKHDLDGMLYWSVTYWSSNPYRTGQQYPGANGDGHLLYPGEDGQPVDSIRWECLRDGLEDYEVFCLLEAGRRELQAKGGPAALLEQATKLLAIDDGVARSVRDWNQDPAALLAARRAMSDTLEAVVAALGHEPSITGRPRRRASSPPPAAETAVAPPGTPVPTWHEPAAAPADGLVLRYDFDGDVPFAFDRSGQAHHGRITGCRRVAGPPRAALAFGERATVTLPSGASLLGPVAEQGTIALWAQPDFAPQELSNDLWDGYRTLVYAMQTDGNGLPDGYDEIGLFCHGGQLVARCAGGTEGPFAVIPSPLRKGVWTHLALSWTKDGRALYVDGRLAAERRGAFAPSKLDEFPAALGIHPASHRWSWAGQLAGLRIWRRGLSAAEVADLVR